MTNVHELAGEVSRGMLFGDHSGNLDFLESAEAERKEREKKMKLEKKKREEVIRKAEEEKKKQELADFHYALEEQKKINRELRSSGVRGHRSHHQINEMNFGRGRMIPSERESQDNNNFFRRERLIRNQLNQLPGGEGIHSNNVQIQFWQGNSQPQYSSFYPRTGQEQYEDIESYSSTDLFEDAQSVKSKSPSPLNSSQPSENTSFQSCSSGSISPVPARGLQSEAPKTPPPEHLSPREKKRIPRQKRGSRIAANFSNCEEEETPEREMSSQQDFFAVTPSAAQPPAPSGSRFNNTTSINSVRSSQRIITPTSNISAVILRHLSQNGDFILNDKDFPPLN